MSETQLVVARPQLPTLYEAEESLLALLDTEDLVQPEQEAEFRQDLARQLEATIQKRDNVASFISACEAQADFAAEEIERLRRRKAAFENAAQRLRSYVVSVIEAQGPDAKGKLKKLVGQRFTMSARACAASVDVFDEALVPLKYKHVTVSMPAEDWEALFDAAGSPVIPGSHVAYSIDKVAIKAELSAPPVPCWHCGGIGMVEAPRDEKDSVAQCPVCFGACNIARIVPGADLVVGKLSLQIR